MAVPIKHQNCPNCNAAIKFVSAVHGSPDANPGDVTICVNCACVFTLDESLHMQPATAELLDSLSPEIVLAIFHAQCAIREMRAGRN